MYKIKKLTKTKNKNLDEKIDFCKPRSGLSTDLQEDRYEDSYKFPVLVTQAGSNRHFIAEKSFDDFILKTSKQTVIPDIVSAEQWSKGGKVEAGIPEDVRLKIEFNKKHSSFSFSDTGSPEVQTAILSKEMMNIVAQNQHLNLSINEERIGEMSAIEGSGVIAGGAMRAVLENESKAFHIVIVPVRRSLYNQDKDQDQNQLELGKSLYDYRASRNKKKSEEENSQVRTEENNLDSVPITGAASFIGHHLNVPGAAYVVLEKESKEFHIVISPSQAHNVFSDFADKHVSGASYHVLVEAKPRKALITDCDFEKYPLKFSKLSESIKIPFTDAYNNNMGLISDVIDSKRSHVIEKYRKILQHQINEEEDGEVSQQTNLEFEDLSSEYERCF